MNKDVFGDLNLLVINDLRSIDMFQLKLEKGKFIPLYGPNGSGKSTVMESLEIVFSGGGLAEGSIRDGKDEAKIEVGTTTGYKIVKRIRTIKSGKKKGTQTSELIMTKDNQPVPKAQTVLKELFAGFMTPNKMAMASGAMLYTQMVKASGIDTVELDKVLNKAKEDLSGLNSVIKEAGIPKAPEGERPKSTTPFDAEAHEALLLRRTTITAFFTEHDRRVTEIDNDKIRIDSLRADLEKEVQSLASKVNSYETKIKPRCEQAETAKIDNEKDIEKSIEASRISSTIAPWNQYDENLKIADTRNDKKEVLEKSVKDAGVNRKKAIESASTGVDGLSLTADGKVIFNGHEWDNAAFSERMLVSATLSLQNLDKEKLPFMFIEHGESLSKSKRESIAKVAIAQGATVFIEVMMEDTSNCKDGVVMRLTDTEPVIAEKPYVNPPIIPTSSPEVVWDKDQGEVHVFGNDSSAAPYETKMEITASLSDGENEIEIDLSGDVSDFTSEQIEEAIVKKSDIDDLLRETYPEATKPSKTPEELGMKKAVELALEEDAFPEFDFFSENPLKKSQAKKELEDEAFMPETLNESVEDEGFPEDTEVDDPWEKTIDIF